MKVWKLLGAEAAYFLGLLLFLVFVYSPLLWTPFFFYDDYVQLGRTDPALTDLLRVYLPQLRPGYALFLYVANRVAGTIPESVVLRSLGVVGLALLGSVIFYWLRFHRFETKLSIAATALLVSLPTFQSTLGYASIICGILSALASALAVVAVFLGRRLAVARSSRVQSSLITGAFVLISTLLTAAAVATYQPPAVFCWVMVAISLSAPRVESWPSLRTAVLLFSLSFAVACASTYWLSHAALGWTGIEPIGRSALVGSPAEALAKLEWFYGVVIPDANARFLASIHEPWYMARGFYLVLAALTLLCAFLLPFLRRAAGQPGIRARLEQLLLLVVSVPLAYLPILVVRENALLSVYMTALQPLLVILLLGGATHAWSRMPIGRQGRERLLSGGVAVMALVFAICCNRNMQRVYVAPNSLEYLYVKTRLARAQLGDVDHVHIKGSLHFSDVLSYSERLVRLALNEVGARQPMRITSSLDFAPKVIHPVILDRNLRLLEPAYEMTPHGYYVQKAGLSAEKRAELDRYFDSLATRYEREGALVVDIRHLREATGRWRGLF